MNKTSSPPRRKTAVPPEVKEQLKRFKSASLAGVHLTATIDAVDALDSLRSVLEHVQIPVTLNSANKICNNLKRSALRKPRKLDCKIKYSDQTIRMTAAVFIQLVRDSMRSISGAEAQSSRTKKRLQKSLNSLIALCLETLVMLCEKADRDSSWKYCMEYISGVAGLANTSSNELLQDTPSNAHLAAMGRGLISGLRGELSSGRVSEAMAMFGSVRSHTLLRQMATDSLRALLQNESARLPISSQEWMLTTLGIERGSPQLSYANPADAPEIRHAAGLLLLLWDNSSDSSAMREAFERFRTLCERHFHLYLKGQSGEVTDYDSRLHEVAGAEAGRVRLTRPWIEFLDPPHSAIVIRALATPA